MVMIREVVKIQRPIFTTDPDAPWLCCNKQQDRILSIPDRKMAKHVKEFMVKDGMYKCFVDAVWTDDHWTFALKPYGRHFPW